MLLLKVDGARVELFECDNHSISPSVGTGRHEKQGSNTMCQQGDTEQEGELEREAGAEEEMEK